MNPDRRGARAQKQRAQNGTLRMAQYDGADDGVDDEAQQVSARQVQELQDFHRVDTEKRSVEYVVAEAESRRAKSHVF